MFNNLEFDAQHIWHPYSGLPSKSPIYEVVDANGINLTLSDGRILIDGMASWWSVIHGYKHPLLQDALKAQIDNFSHVMFGGLTHKPAINLARKLIELTTLPKVFFADAGSVAVEVALKLALQYQVARGNQHKTKIVSLRGAYHGDTIGAMSVCDPVNSMHSMFSAIVPQQLFVPRPDKVYTAESMTAVNKLVATEHQRIAAFIVEPVVQGAGGMYFYDPQYLKRLRKICDEYDILLIADEIATGFGRTGRLFACEHADIKPDIMCLGKALTGGMLTLAATLTTDEISDTISSSDPGVFMHGPTFMANPLACNVALASINLLLSFDWQQKIAMIELWLKQFLTPCAKLENVTEVRVLGAIGVVELADKVDMLTLQPALVNAGVWVRPFNNLVYIMPSYIINENQLEFLCQAIFKVLSD